MLSERQMQIVEFITTAGKITRGDVAKIFAIIRQEALKKLKKLVDLAVIKLVGQGRGAHYILC